MRLCLKADIAKDEIMKTIRTAILLLAGLLSFGSPGVAPAADSKNEQKPPGEQKVFQTIDVTAFEKLRADKKNVVLDVRTPKEFEAGHIPGAVNMDVNSPDFPEKVAKLDKSKTYLVHCAAGVRSAKACDKMSKLDFPRLYNLEGGFRAWEKAGNSPEK